MTDDRLDRAVTALQQVAVPVTWADVTSRVDRGDEASPDHDPAPPRRRRRALLALAAAALVVVGIVVAWPDTPEEGVRTGPGQTTSPSTAPTTPPATTDPSVTAPATRTSRTFAVTAVTDTEYLVYGGEAGDLEDSVRADGFAVDLATGAVRGIPASPLPSALSAAGVWDGDELVVCCGTPETAQRPGPRAAAWDPGTSEWRVLADPPPSIADRATLAVWTGSQVVVVPSGASESSEPTEGPAASYDPASDTWTEIPAPPETSTSSRLLWTGDEVVLWATADGSGRVPRDPVVADRGYRWAPGDATWQPLPDLPEGARTNFGTAVWTGSELVVWGEATGAEGLGVGARWRPGDGGWRPMAPSPQGTVAWYEGTPGSQSVIAVPDTDRVLVKGLEPNVADPTPPSYVYDLSADSWTPTELRGLGRFPGDAIAAGKVFVPDSAAPIVGSVPG